MTLLICWVAFPFVLGLLALGSGLLLQRAAGVRLPGALLLPAGLALIVVVGNFTTMTDATAELSTPAVVAVAVAGLAFSPPWRMRPDAWALAAALGVLAVFAAPVVLSGQATFAGYHALDDIAIWLALNDNALEHGRSLAGVAPSGYESFLDSYLDTGYPLGSFVPLGIGRTLVGQDAAWLFQPYLAFMAVMLALGLYTLTAQLIESPRVRALIAFVASQPALLFAFSLWGGIKEMALALILALTAALVTPALRGEGVRSLLPLAVASAAAFAVMSIAGGVWLALLLLITLGVAIRLRGQEVALHRAATFSVLGAALSLPSLVTAIDFLGPAGHTLTSGLELGRLVRGPLSLLQAFGIWPSGDFRLDPEIAGATYPLIVIVAAAGVVGLAWAWSRQAWGPLSYVGTTILGSLLVISFGSPWMDAKAFAIASPALVAAGLLGAAWAFESGYRLQAALVATAIAGGVLWSNTLTYLHVPLAPRDRLVEFDRIGERFAGQGPTLVTEDNPYAVLHFLRATDPEGTSAYRHEVRLRINAMPPELGDSVDTDELLIDDLLFYRTLVLRHSPVGARPPSGYKLEWSGRNYEVWQRPRGPRPRIADHLPLGDRLQPVARPRCRDVLRLAHLAKGGRLVAARRPPVTTVRLGQVPHAPSWFTDPQDPSVLIPHRSGSIEFDLRVRKPGQYDVWLRGSFQRRLELWMDGVLVGDAREQLNYDGEYHNFGEARLTAGRHRIKIHYGGTDLHPGSGARGFALGPLVLTQRTADRALVYVRPENARSLCGKTLDWVEAVRS